MEEDFTETRPPNMDESKAGAYTLLLILISICLLLLYDQFKERKRNVEPPEEEFILELSECGEDEKKFIAMIRVKETGEELKQLSKQIDPNSHTNCILYNDTETETKYSLLMFASHYDHLEAFRLLIRCGANPTWRNNYGATVLMMIAKRGQFEMANECLDAIPSKYGRDVFVNMPNNKGWSPLMAAIENNHAKMANWLLQNGANPNATMLKTKWSGIHAAAKQGNKEMLTLLQRSGGDNGLQADHKIFGNNSRPMEILTCHKIMQEDKIIKDKEAEKLQIKATREVGQRALIAMITVTEFVEDLEDETTKFQHNVWTYRKGAEFDKVLQDTFLEAFDCKVLTFDDPLKSKQNYFKFLDQIKSEIRKQNPAQKETSTLSAH